MLGLLHSLDERFCFRINHRLTRVRASKFLYRIHGIEAKQRDEFHFIAIFTNEQFGTAVTFDLSRGDGTPAIAAVPRDAFLELRRLAARICHGLSRSKGNMGMHRRRRSRGASAPR